MEMRHIHIHSDAAVIGNKHCSRGEWGKEMDPAFGIL